MRVKRLDQFQCDSGSRFYSFLKVSTDDGITGWSEFSEFAGSQNLGAVIDSLAQFVVGEDPRAVERISTLLSAKIRQAPGGISQRAIGAIENALVDIKAKALGIPVYELLGGPMRERIPLYWSHCGLFRIRQGTAYGHPPFRSLDDVVSLGREVKERGFRALKANLYVFEDGRARLYQPAWGGRNYPACNPDRTLIRAIVDELSAFRAGAGDDVDIHLDANFHFRPEGFIRLARALEDVDLGWLEVDVHDPAALATIRRAARVPIASCETLHGRRAYKPYFEQYAVDVAVVDVAWNGILESLKIAAAADTYEVNVAPHNYGSPLLDLMSAHFSAVVPNLRIMEYDADGIPWNADLLTHEPVIEHGNLILPSGPGWGAEINEDALRQHPPVVKRGAPDLARV